MTMVVEAVVVVVAEAAEIEAVVETLQTVVDDFCSTDRCVFSLFHDRQPMLLFAPLSSSLLLFYFPSREDFPRHRPRLVPQAVQDVASKKEPPSASSVLAGLL